jgi:hypothetical protein
MSPLSRPPVEPGLKTALPNRQVSGLGPVQRDGYPRSLILGAFALLALAGPVAAADLDDYPPPRFEGRSLSRPPVEPGLKTALPNRQVSGLGPVQRDGYLLWIRLQPRFNGWARQWRHAGGHHRPSVATLESPAMTGAGLPGSAGSANLEPRRPATGQPGPRERSRP